MNCSGVNLKQIWSIYMTRRFFQMCSGVQIAPFFNLVPNFFLKSILYYLKKIFFAKSLCFTNFKGIKKSNFFNKTQNVFVCCESFNNDKKNTNTTTTTIDQYKCSKRSEHFHSVRFFLNK